MPLYQYRCEAGHITDEVVPFNERNDPVSCETCGQPAGRIISAVRHNILFKPGYYHTVGSWCETEMEYHNKYSKAVDKTLEDLYSGGRRGKDE